MPGVNAWKVKANGTYTSELLVPPSIAGSQGLDYNKPIIIQEGENLRLRCAATGFPRPLVEWRREDKMPISVGAWQGKCTTIHVKLSFPVQPFRFLDHYPNRNQLCFSFFDSGTHLEHHENKSNSHGLLQLPGR